MLSDPICALATPLGRSAIAVVRLSGRGAIDLARHLIGSTGTERELEPRRATLVTLRDGAGEPIDQALLTVFPGPDSYTGDDLVEISCHGGLATPAAILARLEALGARPAAPGEFTRRALENGKLDLLQAEAVSDIIDATSRAQTTHALRQLDGGLSKRVVELRDELLQALALYSYDIDFPDEDDGPIDRSRIERVLDQVAGRLARLLATAPLGERLRAGAVVVVAGRPNAGKSSLFNGLLGTARALVTEVPGTTRDAIEAATEIRGWPIRLVDTAGVRVTDDQVERLGIEVSWKYLDRADLVLLCVDNDRPLDAEEMGIAEHRPTLVVRTKIDLASGIGSGPADVRVSTVTGQGLDDLQQILALRLFANPSGFGEVEPLLARERHRTAVARAADEIQMAQSQMVAGGEPVLAAHHIKMAATALEDLIGAVGVEDVLAKVFSQFCVGK